MKKIVVFLTAIVCFQTISAQAQSNQSNCIVSNLLITHYDDDIKHLALKRVFDLNSPYMDSIKISENHQDTIRKGLAAIFNLTNVIERDSVFDKYCIHHFNSIYVIKSIYVTVDKNYAWTQQWKNLKTTTGIAALDKLLSTYGFTVKSYSSLINYATLETNQNINVKPLCDSIQTFGGVLYAEPKVPNGSGDEIYYAKAGSDRFYDFTVGYGDCLSGCISKHTFKFKVSSNCSVDYLGVFDGIKSGYSLPKPINCNITASGNAKNILTEPFKIYPNPVNSTVFVETAQDGNIEIFNIQGQFIMNTTINQSTTNVDVSYLTGGVYLLKATAGNETRIIKIIKQ